MDAKNVSVDLLAELDNVSKMHTLNRETIDEVMLIMAKKIVCTLQIERMSVWLLNSSKDALVSMGEYDSRNDAFQKNNTLKKADFKEYFNAIEQNKILYAEDVRIHPFTQCLNTAYSVPNDVITLLDIPLRLEGELIGVMCYEKTGDVEKKFSVEEKSFAFSVSLILVSNLEARYRRSAQRSLEKMIHEKELLIKEMNHRVKNNFTILISLLRISKEQGNLKSPEELLEEYQQRIFSMMKIHDLLFESGNFNKVDLGHYISELCNEYRNSHPELYSNITAEVANIGCSKSSKEGLYVGLIVTEIFLNALKHVSEKTSDFHFNISFYRESENFAIIEIKDNGPGFNFEHELEKATMGLSLIKDLISELEYPIQFPSLGNSLYRIKLPL